jgi:hypothetical protein
MHIIYDRNMFAVQATSVNDLNCFFAKSLKIVNDKSRVDRMRIQVVASPIGS